MAKEQEPLKLRNPIIPEFYHIPARVSKLLFATLLLMVVMLITWSMTSYLDEVAFGEGQIIPSSKVQTVQNLEGGILIEMRVAPGDTVKKGDVLARLDDTAVGASAKGDMVLLQGYKAKEARLVAEAEGKAQNFDGLEITRSFIENEQQYYNARQRTLESEKSVLTSQLQQRKSELLGIEANITKMKATLSSLDEEVAMTRPMVEQGVSAKVELLRLEREADAMRGDVEIAQESAKRVVSSIIEVENRIKTLRLNFQASAREELSEVRVALSSIIQEMAAEEDRVNRTVITAPLSGIVSKVHVNTLGAVVSAGETFIEIVPTDEVLVVEVRIDPKDIGFIHAGQPAQVRLTAYDSSIYGAMSATVKSVGADSITDEATGSIYYNIYVETQNQYVGTETMQLPILPGMVADVSIITGKRTVMDYFLKPIRRLKERALREP